MKRKGGVKSGANHEGGGGTEVGPDGGEVEGCGCGPESLTSAQQEVVGGGRCAERPVASRLECELYVEAKEVDEFSTGIDHRLKCCFAWTSNARLCSHPL